jgi:hypothetical protein
MDDPRDERFRARLRLPLLVLAAVIATGTIGYSILWWGTPRPWLDALYMTIITRSSIRWNR